MDGYGRSARFAPRTAAGEPVDLSGFDQCQASMQEAYPGWRVWYIPGPGMIWWYAHPWPLIRATGVMGLGNDIDQAHAEAAERWPALRVIR